VHAPWAVRNKQVSHSPPAGIQCGISNYFLIHALRMLENRVLRKVIGPKGNKVTGKWSKLHREDLYGLNSSPSLIRVIKSKGTRQVRHVRGINEKTCTQCLGDNLEEKIACTT